MISKNRKPGEIYLTIFTMWQNGLTSVSAVIPDVDGAPLLRALLKPSGAGYSLDSLLSLRNRLRQGNLSGLTSQYNDPSKNDRNFSKKKRSQLCANLLLALILVIERAWMKIVNVHLSIQWMVKDEVCIIKLKVDENWKSFVFGDVWFFAKNFVSKLFFICKILFQ